jgi:peptidoglycan/LPS O-acetylase OafA/YrhL
VAVSVPSDDLAAALRTSQLDRNRRYFPGLDGLRGIAAYAVLLYHLGIASWYTYVRPIGKYTGHLDAGVSVFFALSGFLLYRPFVRARLAGEPGPAVRSYAGRRLRRIIPAYWVALTVYILMGATKHVVGIKGLIIHYGFLQIYFPQHALYGMGVAWSICTEMSFYAFLPIYAWLQRRFRDARGLLRTEFVGVGLLYASSVLFRWYARGHVHRTGYAFWLISTTDLFAMGMFLAIVSAWFEIRGSEPKWCSARAFPTLSWVAAGVAFWLVCSHIGLPRSPNAPVGINVALVRQALFGVVAFFLVLPATLGPPTQGLVRRFLASGPMKALGLVSYGIYLWHPLVISRFYLWAPVRRAVGLFVWTSNGHPVGFWLPWITITVVTIAIASASYFLVERPFLRRRPARIAIPLRSRSSNPRAQT